MRAFGEGFFIVPAKLQELLEISSGFTLELIKLLDHFIREVFEARNLILWSYYSD